MRDKKQLIFSILMVAVLSCKMVTEPPVTSTPLTYGRYAVSTIYTDYFPDTTYHGKTWLRIFGSNDLGSYRDFTPAETLWNCNSLKIQRHLDTVMLEAFSFVPPDSSWETQFKCLDSQFLKFVIQADGTGKYIGSDSLRYNPNVKISGDTLSFDMTIVYYDRGALSPAGQPDLIRWPYYGALPTASADSLHNEATKLGTVFQGQLAKNPFYRMDWQHWIYIAQY